MTTNETCDNRTLTYHKDEISAALDTVKVDTFREEWAWAKKMKDTHGRGIIKTYRNGRHTATVNFM